VIRHLPWIGLTSWIVLAGGAHRVAAQCGPDWAGGFHRPGAGNLVRALALFDDGGGPALYAAGSFTNIGGVEAGCIARWNGSSWSPLGSGLNGPVHALAVFDDGTGRALYAGGEFTSAGGVGAAHIARWNGSTWSAVDGGMNGNVYALAVITSGGTRGLYAGGDFSTAGGLGAARIARWTGQSWSALGNGVNGDVQALAAMGGTLYAGGWFTTADGFPANHIARWDGSTWAALGIGMDGPVTALTVYDSGAGPALHAGGYFTTAGDAGSLHIARWTGSAWASLGAGVDGNVYALTVFNDGSGLALYAGGEFTIAGGGTVNGMARWNGTGWSTVGDGVSGGDNTTRVLALAGFNNRLIAAGDFTAAGRAAAHYIAQWNGAAWSACASGNGMNRSVRAIAVFDDGGGPALYAGGWFTTAGSAMADRIAQWNGSAWSALAGSNGLDGSARALAVFDDGTGQALYAGGEFTIAGGVSANGVAKWNGATWSPLGAGVTGTPGHTYVAALAVFDDGSGPALFAGGRFSQAGTTAVVGIAKWNGSSWSSAGDVGGPNPYVHALAVFDDGTGQALYAGGDFILAGGVVANRIARRTGTTWFALGGGLNGSVRALVAFDDGTGPALYAGGEFTTDDGGVANRIARWKGGAWSQPGGGADGTVHALTVLADVGGAALYAGGAFSSAGGVAANRIARWDRDGWSPLGGGLNDYAYCLAGFNDGTGPALYAGGIFTQAGGTASAYVAKWSSAGTDPASFVGCMAGPGVTPNPAQSCLQSFDFDGDDDVDLADFARLQRNWFSGGLDLAGFTGCMAGPGATPNPAESCLQSFDLDGDDDVDLADFARLQRACP